MTAESNAEASSAFPPRWTVGQLRAALGAYDDDMPLQVAVPDFDRPAELVDDAFVVTGAGVGTLVYGDQRGTVAQPYLTIELYPLVE
ncbi:hypothetical protein VM98_26645 [Streptomyces rubellomurinus subsp. indigoferus]|nr:hypothetical protein VM98_26645 [Streptomyces rubellomurinus subsp. indigoferus]